MSNWLATDESDSIFTRHSTFIIFVIAAISALTLFVAFHPTMNVGINMMWTIMGASVVTLSIMGWNMTNRVRADIAAMEKMIKVE